MNRTNLQNILIKNKEKFIAQTFQQRQQNCSENWLDFQPKYCQPLQMTKLQVFCQPLSLEKCAKVINDRIKYFEQKTTNSLNTIKKGQIKKIKIKLRNKNLSFEQRQKISDFQSEGWQNSVIASIMNIHPCQVQANKKHFMRINCKQEIQITDEQKKWMINECSKSSNTALFSASKLLKHFHNSFNITPSSQYQVQNSFFKTFVKFQQRQNSQIYRFIKQVCGYINQNYKLIFIDECSLGTISRHNHKQWHCIGSSSRIQIEQVDSILILASIGEDNFLRYQVQKGMAGLSFKSFLQNICLSASEHYQDQNFVLIFNNSRIHKCNLMENLPKQIPHIFTPPYRPDMNGIEYLFQWIKQFIVKQQPFLYSRFQAIVHQAFSQIDDSLREGWTRSIFKPMRDAFQNYL